MLTILSLFLPSEADYFGNQASGSKSTVLSLSERNQNSPLRARIGVVGSSRRSYLGSFRGFSGLHGVWS